MPQLVRLYIVSIAIGFALALFFTGALIALDVAGLRHLVGTTHGGWIAVIMLIVFHTILFSGVQFGIRIMLMADDEHPTGGLRQRLRNLSHRGIRPRKVAQPVRADVHKP